MRLTLFYTMSFSRLRRSKRYLDVIAIYEQVQGEPFYGKQVGMNHSKISVLKSYGDIICLKNQTHKINSKKITYEVQMYQLAQYVTRRITEDVEKGIISVEFRAPIIESLVEEVEEKMIDEDDEI